MTILTSASEVAEGSSAKRRTSEVLVHDLLDLSREAGSRAQYFHDALEGIGSFFQAPYAACEVRLAAGTVKDQYVGRSTNPDYWREVVQELVTDAVQEPKPLARMFRGEEGRILMGLFAAPVLELGGGAVGAFAMVAPCSTREDGARLLDGFHSLVTLVGLCGEAIGSPAPVADVGVEAPSGTALRKAAEFHSREELAFSITSSLRNRTGCEQVVLGLMEKNRVRPLSISGLDEVKKRSPGVLLVKDAMEECADAGRVVVYQGEGRWDSDKLTQGYRLHRAWHESAGGASVLSIPLVYQGRTTGVVSLRRGADKPFGAEEIEETTRLVAPFAGAIELVDRANRGLLAHARASAARFFGAILGRGHLVAKSMCALALFAFLWVAFGSMSYSVAVATVVTPVEVRYVGAPFDGVLRSSGLVAGDRFRSGDVLAELDTRELELEVTRIRSELAIADLEERRAFADGERVKAQISRAERDRLEARLEMLNLEIEQAALRAPFDGVVLVGDLSQRIGDVMQKGEPLFQVAPDSRWSLELAVPEPSIDELSEGLPARFASFARPEEPQEVVLTRVRPSAEQRDGRTVFVVEADPADASDWVRIGMEGLTVIDVGQRPVWWIAGHRMIDFVRLNFLL